MLYVARMRMLLVVVVMRNVGNRLLLVSCLHIGITVRRVLYWPGYLRKRMRRPIGHAAKVPSNGTTF